jgi:hypothetical protein
MQWPHASCATSRTSKQIEQRVLVENSLLAVAAGTGSPSLEAMLILSKFSTSGKAMSRAAKFDSTLKSKSGTPRLSLLGRPLNETDATDTP